MTSDDIVAVGGEGEALCARAICRDPITCRDDCLECADRHGPPVPPGALCQRCIEGATSPADTPPRYSDREGGT